MTAIRQQLLQALIIGLAFGHIMLQIDFVACLLHKTFFSGNPLLLSLSIGLIYRQPAINPS